MNALQSVKCISVCSAGCIMKAVDMMIKIANSGIIAHSVVWLLNTSIHMNGWFLNKPELNTRST